MRRKLSHLFLVLAALALSGCMGAGQWETSYRDVIDPTVSKNWHVASIDVSVPRSLTVSEQNSYAPEADIVWQEEPYGDRYDQVDRIMTEAAMIGGKSLKGSYPVHMTITLTSFHALTHKTRYSLEGRGVHNIAFTIQLYDATTGNPLTGVEKVRADLVAYTGREAILSEARGETQRTRIIAHVSKVIAGWLGAGPDVRGRFQRSGR